MVDHAHEMIGIIWLTLGAVWLLTGVRSKPNATRASFRSRALELAILVPAGVLLFLDRPRLAVLDAQFLAPTATTATLGIGLAACGVVFACVARLYLGRNWSAAARIKEDHELIRRGPYRLVRHPIYTGLLTAAIGTSIAFGEIRTLLALPLLFVAIWLKLRLEEELLLTQFGDRYMTYRREVPSALFPYLL